MHGDCASSRRLPRPSADAQVPPVAGEGPGTGSPVSTMGAAVSVSGPALAPVAELLTVTVPVFAVPFAGVDVSAGVGPANAAVPPVTVNASELLVPPGVVMDRFLFPSGARREMFKVALTVVFEITVRLVTGISAPIPLIAKAPFRFVPVNVTVTLLPRVPESRAD